MKNIFKKFVHDSICPAVETKELDICLPVSIKGVAEVGEVATKCDGPPRIIPNTDFCPGKHDHVFKFVVRQKIKVEVPVAFGARTSVGDYTVHFDDMPCEPDCDCDCDCDKDCDCDEDCNDDCDDDCDDDNDDNNGGNQNNNCNNNQNQNHNHNQNRNRNHRCHR